MNVRSWLSARYAEALALVEPWLGPAGIAADITVPSEPNALFEMWMPWLPHRHTAVEGVLALRARVATISAATTDDFQAVWPAMDRSTAERLAALAGELRGW